MSNLKTIRTSTTGRLRNPDSVTDYFEIDSAHIGDRFAISVSFPSSYSATDSLRYPILYATDGNLYGPIAEAVMSEFAVFDAVVPVQSFLQVSIGFTADQTPQANTLRIRNLGLPGARMPAYMEAHVRKRLGADAIGTFVENYEAGRADRFLAFIEEELHPAICRRYRVQVDEVGLFGYSAGGLFSLYALTSGSRLFNRYGAAAAGVFSDDCLVFGMYEQLLQRSVSAERQIHLHLSINSYELFGAARLYRVNMFNLLRFFDTLVERPLPGLHITTDILGGQSHSSGWVDGYRSFVRACYPKPS